MFGNIAQTCQQLHFYSEFQKYIFFYLWLIVCIKVVNNGANNKIKAKMCAHYKVVFGEFFQLGKHANNFNIG